MTLIGEDEGLAVIDGEVAAPLGALGGLGHLLEIVNNTEGLLFM